MKNESIVLYCLLAVIIILGGLAIYYGESSFEKDYKFYSEWCPRLGVEVSEPVEGYTWRRACFRVNDNIMTKYWIKEINTTDKYYLMEYK